MKIAHLFDDPTVRAMLEAAERDEGGAGVFVTPEPVLPPEGEFCELEAA